MLNAAAGPQAVVIFEHTVQTPIHQLMQLQTYSNHSLTEAFKAAEKVADILEKDIFLYCLTDGTQRRMAEITSLVIFPLLMWNLLF